MKLFVAVQQQQIFHINNADYIICRIFINRDSRIPLFAVNFQKLVICVIHLGKRHIYSWHHNIFRQTFAKIKHIRNHLLFFCFQNALFMAYFNNGTKFIFGNRFPFFLCIDTTKLQHNARKKINQKNHRRQHSHQKINITSHF